MKGDRMGRNVRTVDDVLQLLDGLFAPEAARWTADAATWSVSCMADPADLRIAVYRLAAAWTGFTSTRDADRLCLDVVV